MSSFHGRRDYQQWLGDARLQPVTSNDQLRAQAVFGLGKQYRVIHVDPPWRYEVWARDTGLGRSAEAHYPTMALNDLKALPVRGLAATDCVLLMWATWPTIQDAFALGKAWGFTYKTCAFLWAKQTQRRYWFMGMGYWTRANTEPLLLFTRGKPKRLSASVRQLFVAPVGKHSEKPLGIYDEIEALLPGPYVELFARRRKPGWDVWGNEAPAQPTPWPAPLFPLPGFEHVTAISSEVV